MPKSNHRDYLRRVRKAAEDPQLRKAMERAAQSYSAARAEGLGPVDFEALLSTQGVGAKTIRSLALISELVYGVEPSFRDPAIFSFAHGGKDGHPYPVDRENYDLSIEVLSQALSAAKIGRTEKLKAMRRLAFLEGQGAPPEE